MLREPRIKALWRVTFKVLLSTFPQQTAEQCCRLASRGPQLILREREREREGERVTERDWGHVHNKAHKPEETIYSIHSLSGKRSAANEKPKLMILATKFCISAIIFKGMAALTKLHLCFFSFASSAPQTAPRLFSFCQIQICLRQISLFLVDGVVFRAHTCSNG